MISKKPSTKELSLSQRAYAHLQQKLLSGELQTGSVVSEQSLASEIGMSRTPMREAIRALEREGILEQVPRFGTIVRKLERRDLIELYELREAIEPFAVAHAAEQVLPEDLLTLRQLCDAVEMLSQELSKSKLPTLNAAQMRRLLSADLGFHVILLRASGNQRMMKIVSDSRLLTGIFGTQRQPHTAAVLDAICAQHRAILEAVERGNAKTASRLMTAHIAASKAQALAAHDQEHSHASRRSFPLAMPEQMLADIDHIEARRASLSKAKRTAP